MVRGRRLTTLNASRRWAPTDGFHRLNGGNRPRLCRKSGRSLPVGRISIFSPSYELEWEKTWDNCSKHSRSFGLSPADLSRHDFFRTLDRFETFKSDQMPTIMAERKNSGVSGLAVQTVVTIVQMLGDIVDLQRPPLQPQFLLPAPYPRLNLRA